MTPNYLACQEAAHVVVATELDFRCGRSSCPPGGEQVTRLGSPAAGEQDAFR